MNLRSALLAATVLALPLAAQAQPVTGLYVGAGVGYNILGNQDINVPGSLGLAGVAGSGGQLQFQGGFVGKASVGWGFGNGLRAELEGNYRANKADQASFLTTGNAAGGWEYKYGAMVNVLYDFTTLATWIQPYIGAGVGYEAAKWSNIRAYNGAGSINMSDSTQTKGSFAYQGILGAAFPIAAAPGLAITTEFNYLGMSGNREYSAIASCNTCGAGGKPATGSGSLTSNSNHNYSFLVGVRYNFGVAPPPAPAPVAAPAPAPARSYLVFFDWDKATLTDRARQIIAEAAQNSTKVQYTKIEVNGYTDTSGSPKYNMGLSIRRAQAVAAELVKDGVPKSAIAIQGFGQTHLLVPTADGVREPQNRRVEIIIR
ncbi:MAG: OmpA family protein [Proteobacteria bacterium]|nr:OmpA family protein [Pseudomonadota bacterium]